jgi:hypothetical protein
MTCHIDLAGLATLIKSQTTSFQSHLPTKAIKTIVTANANMAAKNSAYELRLVTGSDAFGDKPSTKARVADPNICSVSLLVFTVV